MNRFQQDIELNENFQPIVGKGAEILNLLLPYLVAIASYLLLLDLGLLLTDVLGDSPIVVMLSALVGFIVVIAGWIVAFLLFGLLGGNFSFAKSVFFLFNDVYFRASVFVLFIGVFIARVVTRVIAQSGISYSTKIKMFWTLTVFILSAFAVFCAFVNKISDCPGKYYFVYLLLGIIYVCIIGCESQEKPEGKLSFPDDYEQKRQENYSRQDLKDILQNL